MSEKKEEKSDGKKGGSKMPVIAAVVLVLAGGGFFMMKGKGSDKPKVKKIELGEPITLKEILVNLKGTDSYLKTEIALQPLKDFKKEEIEKNAALINDAIIVRLKSKQLSQLNTPEDLSQLKREIAEDVNAVLPKEEKKSEEDSSDEETDGKKKKSSDESDSSDSSDKVDSADSKDKTDGEEPAKPVKSESTANTIRTRAQS